MNNGTGSKLKRIYDATSEFLTEKWVATHEEAQASRLHRFAHFWLLAFKSFARNRCPLRATALAYTTLLALVPLLALCVSISSSLLREKGETATRELIGQFVDAAVPQLKLVPKDPLKPVDARQEVVERINQFIANVQSRALGVSGIVGLIVVAILLLSTIEDTFNDIWGVMRGRNWFRRIVQYWTTISLGPIALVLAVVLVSSTYFKSTQDFLETLPFLGKFLYKAMPFVLVSGAFALFYKLMPNTQVHWRAALIGGVMGGSLWLLLNIFNALNLSRVVGVSAIYGSLLGIIPIFLIGLYFSWLIVLFGAQVAYAFQNRLVYLQERKAESVNQRCREFVALRVMSLLAQHFERGEKPPGLLQIANALGVPSRLVGRVLQPLIEARLVLEVSGVEVAYTPARPIEAITCHDVLQTLRAGGGQELETCDGQSRTLVQAEFQKIEEAGRQVAASVTLKELVSRMPKKEPHEHDALKR
jgi:membrane protein